MKKKTGPPHCPLLTVDSISKLFAVAPAETRSDREDGARVGRTKGKAAMVAQANTTQGAMAAVTQHSGRPCSSSTWSLGRTVWR